ncbi:DUF805 domain-containing protein [Novosphingobium terrae]|jgi:uncharacterized membrane protein YhaH (DUF805 family)|uniref:DUF805 domain-containing protein n=1 Tax=Novosphingobium terrae TaxID=2726189 RepID=UPI00197D972B|nr:DUF805 domain-containing protein [Novosphingobium terrae]
MSLISWALLPYRRYAQFSGRSRRLEFWLFHLFTSLTNLALDLLLGGDFSVGLGLRAEQTMLGNVVTAIFGLGSVVPTFAVTARRLHDTNRSQWWMALFFVPILGWLALLIFECQDGTPGPNRFGDDPKDSGLKAVFS